MGHIGIHNLLWFWPPAAVRSAEGPVFLAHFAGVSLAVSLLVLAGGLRPRWRGPALAGLAALFPLHGLVFPMLRHGGDDFGELLQFLVGQRMFTVGEELGTYPFFLLGGWLRESIAQVVRADFHRAFSALGLLGSLGIWLCARTALRFAGRRLDELSAGGWLLLASLALQPFAVIHAGYLQATTLSAILMPWVAAAFGMAVLRARGAQGRAGPWMLLAAVGAAVLFRSHGATAPVLLSVWICLGGFAWRALRGRRWASLAAAGLALLGGGAVFAAIGAYFAGLTGPPLLEQPWTARGASLAELAVRVQAITHTWPKRLPFACQQPLCGQQTDLLGLAWLLFFLSALLHTVNPWLLWRGLAGAGRERFWLWVAAFWCLGFLAVYSPHFGYPLDADVILPAAGFLCLLAGLSALAREREREEPRARRVALAALAYQVVLSAGFLALQQAHVRAADLDYIRTPCHDVRESGFAAACPAFSGGERR